VFVLYLYVIKAGNQI